MSSLFAKFIRLIFSSSTKLLQSKKRISVTVVAHMINFFNVVTTICRVRVFNIMGIT